MVGMSPDESDVEEIVTTNPGIIMFRRHVGFCIVCIAASIPSFPGEGIGSIVISIAKRPRPFVPVASASWP